MRNKKEFLSFALILTGASAAYEHLGCYQDSAQSRDLSGNEVKLQTLTRDECVEQCRKDGFPYAGLHEGEVCFCGDNYGEHGKVSDASTCNYTCDDGVSCGGHLANDIYYTIDRASASEAGRALVYYTTAETFLNARKRCIQKNGDLAMTLDNTLNDTVYTALNTNSDEATIWIGLRKGLNKGITGFQWVDATEDPYIDSAFSSRWDSKDSKSQDCVVVTTDASQHWQSVSCDNEYRFVCWQVPTSDTTSDTKSTTDEEDEGFDKTKLSLYLVLPMFIFCYGGSCILYCAAKLYKSCKKKKRQKMLLANAGQTEYEPDTKPQSQPQSQPQQPVSMMGLGPPPPAMNNIQSGGRSPRPLSGNKNAKVSPAPGPLHPGYNQMYNGNQQAREQFPPPMPSKQPPQYSSQPTADMFAAKSESRPLTSGGVEISMKERDSSSASSSRAGSASDGPPSSARGRTKEEVKKARLLDNALKEARDRRRQEAIARGEDPDARTNSRLQETNLDQVGSQPPRSKDRKRGGPYAVDRSADSDNSTTNLLMDMDTADSPDLNMDGPPRDPTQMSIQDILKMKVAMNQGRKKKIISA